MIIKSINPATGKLIKTFDEFPIEEIQNLVKKTKLSQKKWACFPKQERVDIILKLKEIIEREKNNLANIVFEEAGFSKSDTLGEITDDILIGIDTHIEDYKKVNNLDYSNQTFQSDVKFVPHGVVGHIGIWNYPVWQTLITAIPALLAGNAIIYKISEYTTMTGLKIAELIWEAGVPKEVFVPIIGGPKVGRELVKSNIDMVVFTGGTRTGNEIIKESGTKPLLLELSGNDAAIICADCDLEQTVRGIIYGSFLHSGQVCTRIKRIFVVRQISDTFIKGFASGTKKLRVGKEITPLIRAEAREKVDTQVKEAITGGAELLLGGEIAEGNGYYYQPTILLYKDSKTQMYQDEIFGPVTLIQVVEDEEEAIKLANDTKYGLGATVWNTNKHRANEIAQQLDVGMVWINDSNVAIPGGVYYGGIKQSGIASSQSRIMSFMKKKTVISNRRAEIREWWF